MKDLLRFAALLLGSAVALHAAAYENLVGKYSGTISEVDGFGGKVGDPCSVVVDESSSLGGALSFEIAGAAKLDLEKHKLEKSVTAKKPVAKHINPAPAFGSPVEIALLRFDDARGLAALRLTLKWTREFREKSIECGTLVKQ